jgi:hypothetical protein
LKDQDLCRIIYITVRTAIVSALLLIGNVTMSHAHSRALVNPSKSEVDAVSANAFQHLFSGISVTEQQHRDALAIIRDAYEKIFEIESKRGTMSGAEAFRHVDAVIAHRDSLLTALLTHEADRKRLQGQSAEMRQGRHPSH